LVIGHWSLVTGLLGHWVIGSLSSIQHPASSIQYQVSRIPYPASRIS
jgi:hypothetical protein